MRGSGLSFRFGASVKKKKKSSNAALAVVLIIVTVLSVLVTIRRMKKPRFGDFPEYAYTAYAVDDAGNAYVFRVKGKGLRWPVNYRGRLLKALYACSDCGHRFAVEPGTMVTSCPACGSRNVGGYNVEYHGPIKAKRIQIYKRR